jgi:hypothetical protein
VECELTDTPAVGPNDNHHHRKYNAFGRTYLFDLDFHHLKQGDENWDVKYTIDAYHSGNVCVDLSPPWLHQQVCV